MSLAELADVLQAPSPCVFLSPHLDDAAFSCGGLLSSLSGRARSVVVSVFTEAAPPPHTLATRSFLRQAGVPDALELYARRRSEDEKALGSLGCDVVHLGLQDALFRRRKVSAAVPSWMRRAVPELVHRYPTYRLDIARGRISGSDREMIAAVAREVAALVRDVGAGVVFLPLGVGRHVDHLITRIAGQDLPTRKIYYAEAPYCFTQSPDGAYLARRQLGPWTFAGDPEAKRALMLQYATQVSAVFPQGPPDVPDYYYVSRS